MNIQGIKLLRELGLPSPEKEYITKNISDINLEQLYKDAHYDITIIACDETEKVNQSPFLEKNARKYKIKKEDFDETLKELTQQLIKLGVDKRNILYIIHQTYTPSTIIYSGRVIIYTDKNENGNLIIDTIDSLREADQDFNPTFSYICPIRANKILRSEEKISKEKLNLPNHIVEQIIADILKVCKEHKNPHIDFEVYSHNGKLFYHDMFLVYE